LLRLLALAEDFNGGGLDRDPASLSAQLGSSQELGLINCILRQA